MKGACQFPQPAWRQGKQFGYATSVLLAITDEEEQDKESENPGGKLLHEPACNPTRHAHQPRAELLHTSSNGGLYLSRRHARLLRSPLQRVVQHGRAIGPGAAELLRRVTVKTHGLRD